jgi:PIN domain nuclease of toxin-antitoxin system
MRLLLDTHILLWALTDDPRLPTLARTHLLNHGNSVYFSSASVWEIAIKRTLPRSNMPISSHQAHKFFLEAGYEELTISAVHAALVESLPPIHSDPFDRILIAQALSEPMRLITHDRIIASYGNTITLV